MPIYLKSDETVLTDVASRLRQLRLLQNLTQAQVAERSLVPLPTYKAFEHTGRISLPQLVAVSNVLGRKDDFELIFRAPPAQTLDDLVPQNKPRQRARP